MQHRISGRRGTLALLRCGIRESSQDEQSEEKAVKFGSAEALAKIRVRLPRGEMRIVQIPLSQRSINLQAT
jgi:hypothetical protein